MATVVIGGTYDGQFFQSSEVIINIKTFKMQMGLPCFILWIYENDKSWNRIDCSNSSIAGKCLGDVNVFIF